VVRRARWGNLRRVRPFSDRYGFDRGHAIDRYYIDRFVESCADDIRGRVLEVADPRYAGAHSDGITRIDVLDVDPRNPAATVVADLDDAGSLPVGVYDCVVLTQTLQYTADPRLALANIWASLVEGGVLLLSVPACSRVDRGLRDRDSWRVTPVGLSRLLTASCPGADMRVAGYGNVLTCAAFLFGLAAEELRPTELDVVDEAFPLVTCARVAKGPTEAP
jgi:SAM-dependent methyltransferase